MLVAPLKPWLSTFRSLFVTLQHRCRLTNKNCTAFVFILLKDLWKFVSLWDSECCQRITSLTFFSAKFCTCLCRVSQCSHGGFYKCCVGLLTCIYLWPYSFSICNTNNNMANNKLATRPIFAVVFFWAGEWVMVTVFSLAVIASPLRFFRCWPTAATS